MGYRNNRLVKDIALELNRSTGSVYQRAFVLGFKKEENTSRFQCGHTINNLPQNTITLRAGGGRWIKRNNTFIPLQKYIWEAANGGIPNGSVLTFIDGNRQNYELSNLRLISRQDLMRLNNGYALYPNEVIQCSRLVNKLITYLKK